METVNTPTELTEAHAAICHLRGIDPNKTLTVSERLKLRNTIETPLENRAIENDDYILNWGGTTNSGVGAYLSLIEFDGTNEQIEIRKQWRKANNDGGDGVHTVDFHTNESVNTNGIGKGWRVYVTSLEGDSNAIVKIKSIRLRAG